MLYTQTSKGLCIFNEKNQLHSLHYPALVHQPSGTKEWYLNGKRHRKILPAIVFEDGGLEFWLNGLRHNIKNPAVAYANGHKEWWVNGKLHREDGPAVIYTNGKSEFWEDGQLLYTYDPTQC
jgi:hypothetical protein